MEAMVWNHKEIVELIDELKVQETLWNPVAVNYSSREARNVVWQQMAKKFKRPVDHIRRKINSLFSSYRRARTRFLRNKEDPPWKYYKYFAFLYEDKKLSDSSIVDILSENVKLFLIIKNKINYNKFIFIEQR